jgi:OOP family OmpA-OmpF porin
MKKIILSAALFLMGSAFAQDSTFNKNSIDFGVGAVNVLAPSATKGAKAPFIDPLSVRVGYRHMANKVVGLGWVLGYDNFSNTTHSISSVLNGYVNLTNLLNFSEFSDKFGMLGHFGAGLTYMKAKGKGRDGVISFVAGIMPQYKYNEKLSINLDLGLNFNLMQSKNFDMKSSIVSPGLSKYFGYGTIGVSYYAFGNGKGKTHADWAPNGDETKKELAALREKVKATEAKLVDSDNDGVADFLDAEPNTPAGSLVNSKGQKVVDMDGDGILDSEDYCPTVKGTEEFKGCPTAFASGANANNNESMMVEGKEVDGELKFTIAKVSNDINFDTKSTKVKSSSKKDLDALAKILTENSDLIVVLNGHCDNVGEDELNNKLSEERATSVKDYLISKGVNASTITTKGYGISKPKVSNDTEKGRATNRRVEVIVRKK